MDWSDSDEQARFRTQVREFVRDRLPDYYRQQHVNRSGLDGGWQADRASDDPAVSGAAREWSKALSDQRWVAPNWPEEYGGAGSPSGSSSSSSRRWRRRVVHPSGARA